MEYKTEPMKIDWDNLINYLNLRDDKNWSIKQWQKYYHLKSKKKKE